MTAFQQADLTVLAERLMLADHFEETGQSDEAEVLRREDAADLAREPHHVTEVVRSEGETPPDEFGRTMNYESRATVSTSYGDHADGRAWTDLLPSERRWWVETLRELHDAEVRLASADLEIREQFEEAIQGERLDDMALVADIYNRILDDLGR